jgi:EPS-associated MarR family transcriptional regulator
MNKPYEQEIDYRLFKIIGRDGNLTQRKIAETMGISLGKVNYCLSELRKKGFIKVKRFAESKTKIRYIYLLTPRGLEEKAKSTLSFLKQKLAEYDEIGQQIIDLRREIEAHLLIDTTSDI